MNQDYPDEDRRATALKAVSNDLEKPYGFHEESPVRLTL